MDMTSFQVSPAAVSTLVPPPVGPPTNGAAPVPPSGAVPPPGAPPTTSRPPLGGISATFVTDLTESSRLIGRAVEMLDTVPRDDVGSEATKDLRIRIYKTNMAAQKRIEQQIGAGNPDAVLSELRRADASLEDANWQLARKPSPDGRFNGVDIPGAIRDTSEGARILNELLATAGGVPTDPSTPPPGGPSLPPPGGPSFPPAPGTSDPEPSRPPTTPPTVPATPPPGSGSAGGGDYPGEDEFPTDDTIRRGGGSGGGASNGDN